MTGLTTVLIVNTTMILANTTVLILLSHSIAKEVKSDANRNRWN